MSHLDWDKPKRKVGHLQWDGGSNTLYVILKIKYFFLDYSIKNETFFKVEITLSLLFLIFSYFILYSLTQKTTLYKIICRKANISYLLGQKEYISYNMVLYSLLPKLLESYSFLGCPHFSFWLKTKHLITPTLFILILYSLFVLLLYSLIYFI